MLLIKALSCDHRDPVPPLPARRDRRRTFRPRLLPQVRRLATLAPMCSLQAAEAGESAGQPAPREFRKDSSTPHRGYQKHEFFGLVRPIGGTKLATTTGRQFNAHQAENLKPQIVR